MDEFYSITKQTFLYIIVTAAVFAAMKIFTKWNRGEDVVPQIFGWVFGMIVATFLFKAVDEFIKGSGSNFINPVGASEALALEGYEASLMIGVGISVFSIVRIYTKYNEGEDVYDPILKWFGSVIFLFFFSYIIEAFF